MKKLTVLVLVLSVLVLLSFPNHAFADVYASGLRVTKVDSDAPFDGTFQGKYGAKINFVLNDVAVVTVRILKDGAPVTQIYAGPRPRGNNYVIWDGSLDAGAPAPAGAYTFSVEASSNGYDTWNMFYDSEVDGHLGIYTSGGDVNSNPANKDFGYIYAGNRSGSPVGMGTLRMNAAGLPAGGDTLGGFIIKSTMNWPGNKGQIGYGVAIDDAGRVYESALDSGYIFRYDPTTDKVTQFISKLHWPRGLALVGKGGTRTLYIASDSCVLRATIGDAAAFTGTLDTVALFVKTRVIDVAIDDAGYMYVNIRTGGTAKDGAAPGATEKYSLSGDLPKKSSDAIWSVKWPAGQPIGMGIYRGGTLTTNIDDRMYVSVVAADSTAGNGVWAIPQIYSSLLPTPVKVFNTPLGPMSSKADMTVDVVGNILLFENSYEHMYFISPPSGPNAFTTYSGAQGITINVVKPGISWRYFSIAKAKEDANRDFKPDFLKKDTIVIQGYVTTPNVLVASGQLSHCIQDNTGGIDMFKAGMLAPVLEVGDSVQVIGTIDFYNGLTELVPLDTSSANIKILKKGPNPNGPLTKLVTIPQLFADGEYYESQLIRIEKMYKQAASPAWPAAGSDANMLMYTETPWGTRDSIIMRLSRSTDIPGSPEPTYPIAVVRGWTTQYTTKVPPNNGYQIQPRYKRDLLLLTDVRPDVANALPDRYVLGQNYPNPFNPSTTIEYGLPQSGLVKLAVYNILGQQVALLADGYKDAGTHRAVFDASRLPSGTYFYMLISNGTVLKNKMVLVK